MSYVLRILTNLRNCVAPKFGKFRVINLPQVGTNNSVSREYYRGKYHCTIDLLFDRFGISCMTTDIFCFYLQKRLIQTSQTGGQQYSDTSPFSIPCCKLLVHDCISVNIDKITNLPKLFINLRNDKRLMY